MNIKYKKRLICEKWSLWIVSAQTPQSKTMLGIFSVSHLIIYIGQPEMLMMIHNLST